MLRSPKGRRLVCAIVPVLLAVLTSLNALWNHFASDDLEQVLNNSFIKHLSNLPKAFTRSVWSFAASDIIFTVDPYFRPIFSSLFTINYALFATSPFGWHLTNILIHASVTFLVFVVFKKLSSRRTLASLTAALFAVHPVHAESVAWVSGVTDPLMAVFLLVAFYFYLQFYETRRWHSLGGVLVFYFLALLSKETAIAFPLVIAYCELFHFKEQGSFRQRLIHLSKLAGFLAVPTGIYFLMRLQALENLVLGGQPRYPLPQALMTIPLAVVKYLGILCIPVGYSYQHYTDFVPNIASLSFLIPIVVLAMIGAVIALLKSRLLNFASMWFILTLVPSLAVIRNFEPAYLLQERYLYVASIGFCLALALGIEWIGAREWFGTRQRILTGALAIIVLVVWSLALVRQNRTWDTSLSVHKNTAAVAPESPMAHVLLSRTYYDSGRPREAEAEANTALELDPQCTSAYMNLSHFANQSGKVAKACEFLENAIATIPETPMTRNDLATTYLNLALLYAQRKMFDRSEAYLLRSIEISPRPVAWYYTGQFYLEQKRFEDARVMYERALEAVPSWFAPIHLKLGLVYEALGDASRAAAEYNKYLMLAPDASDRDDVRNHLKGMKGISTKGG